MYRHTRHFTNLFQRRFYSQETLCDRVNTRLAKSMYRIGAGIGIAGSSGIGYVVYHDMTEIDPRKKFTNWFINEDDYVRGDTHLYKYLPDSHITDKGLENLARYCEKFDDIPKKYLTNKIIKNHVYCNGFTKMRPEQITDLSIEMIKYHIKYHGLSEMRPEQITEWMADHVTDSRPWLFKRLPEKFYTSDRLKRLATHDKLEYFPTNYITIDIAANIVSKHNDQIPYVPNNMFVSVLKKLDKFDIRYLPLIPSTLRSVSLIIPGALFNKFEINQKRYYCYYDINTCSWSEEIFSDPIEFRKNNNLPLCDVIYSIVSVDVDANVKRLDKQGCFTVSGKKYRVGNQYRFRDFQ